MIDLDDNRLAIARRFGATTIINSSDDKAVEAIMKLTHGKGVDVVIEAVGTPAAFDICQRIVGVGGRLANVGVTENLFAETGKAMGPQHGTDHALG